ncbi:MAG: dTMP kinase [Candidatus Taylorbacteria bacterium]|nr:dTMP kinase [Candidatus Taylorbacteria bacterium]
MKKNKRGKFVVLEGGEGSGKSTQLALLQKIYGGSACFTREPGGTPIAEKIRDLILSPDLKDANGYTQFGLFWAARADHMEKLVIPALESGKHVITDRFDSSSYAYQIYGQKAHYLKDLFFKMREVYLGKIVPDLYIFLKVSPRVGLARVAARVGAKGDSNHFDERKADFHKRLTKGYIEFISQFPHIVIDADRSVDEVTEDLKNILAALL